MGDRRIRPARALRRLRLVHGKPAPAPEPSAWLRRYPTGGWTLKICDETSTRQSLVSSLVEAAELISDFDDLRRIHLWSGPSGAYVELDLMSLGPLLEESRAPRPA
jgi:hypothetical protein